MRAAACSPGERRIEAAHAHRRRDRDDWWTGALSQRSTVIERLHLIDFMVDEERVRGAV
jgi:hypothetical protein